MQDSDIGWTTHTWNPWWGCNKVSDECLRCYIEAIMRRAGLEPFRGPMRTGKCWSDPPRWDRAAAKAGTRWRVFTCSMSDFFHPGADAWRDDAWEVIRSCRNLDWLLLTKRPELARERLPADWGRGWPHVWLGVTVGLNENRGRLDHLRDLPAAVRFVSCEPLLERLDLRPYLGWLDWVIVGCEQAAKGKRRVMDLDWVRDLHRQCREYGAAFYFKQAYDGERGVPNTEPLLDGRVVQEVPGPCRLSLPLDTDPSVFEVL
jgi:protein gp37